MWRRPAFACRAVYRMSSFQVCEPRLHLMSVTPEPVTVLVGILNVMGEPLALLNSRGDSRRARRPPVRLCGTSSLLVPVGRRTYPIQFSGGGAATGGAGPCLRDQDTEDPLADGRPYSDRRWKTGPSGYQSSSCSEAWNESEGHHPIAQSTHGSPALLRRSVVVRSVRRGVLQMAGSVADKRVKP